MDRNIILLILFLLLYFSIIFIMFRKNNTKYIKIPLFITVFIIIIYCIYIFFNGYTEIYSSKNIQKKNRIVISLSTLPSRINNIKPVLKSLLNNTIKPDSIYINIPSYSIREQKEYNINEEIYNFNPKIILNKIDTDYGPITKLYPVFEKEQDPDTVIICVDDDIIYDKHLIKNLYSYSQKYPSSCICSRGWSYINFKWGFIPVFSPLLFVKKVSILQCFAGVLYKRGFFNNIDKFKKFMEIKECFTTDDIVISKFLESEGVNILSIPIKYSKSYMSNQNINTLSSFNDSNNIRLKCINYDFSKVV